MGSVAIEELCRSYQEQIMSIEKNSLVRCGSLIMVFILFLQCAGCLPMLNRNKSNEFIPSKPATFAFGIQQDGKKIPVVNHEVTLKRQPFKMIFYFDKHPEMLAQASLGPDAVQMAKAGARMDRIIDIPSQISEDFQNPGGLLYVYSDNFQRYHNWAYLGAESHRYDQNGIKRVARNKTGGPLGYLCTRSVSGLCIDGRDEKIQNCASNALYLVFFTTKRDEKNQLLETNRDWVVIKFK